MPDHLYFRSNKMRDYFSAVTGVTCQAPLGNLLVIKIKFTLYLLADDKGISDSKIETKSEVTSHRKLNLIKYKGFNE